MRLIVWLFRIFVFVALFAFALNNSQDAALRWFFGLEWRAPMVFIVLAAFAFGCAFGAISMVPSWWRHRRTARRLQPAMPVETDFGRTPAGPVTLDPVRDHPPRDGL